MPVTVERDELRWLIRVTGEFTVTAAAELKTVLLEGLASATDLQVDLEGAGEMDVTLMQLLWAAGREAGRQDGGVVGHVSEAARGSARLAGFERFPGTVVRE